MIKVLYVDDEMILLDVGKEFLERTGELSVDTATSVKEAMKSMLDVHYDAIVSDYQMPQISGLEFLKMIRAQDKRIPFILFTGRGREEVVIEALNSGVTAYLQKGGDPDSLFVELEHKIKQASAKYKADRSLLINGHEAIMAMNLAQVATFEFDERTKMFRFDDVFFNLFRTNAAREGGYEISADRYFKEFVHPEDLPRVLDFMSRGEELFHSNGLAEIEHRFIRRDGEIRDIVVQISRLNLKDSYNTVIACGVSHDITELKQAKEITEAHRRCRDALDDHSG